MARGIEVLQAAMRGKKIRAIDMEFPGDGWLTWGSRYHQFWDERHKVVDLLIGTLWREDWEIEREGSQCMTFADAMAAMDAGKIVERKTATGGTIRYRRVMKQTTLQYQQTALPWRGWHPMVVDADVMSATDWTIVGESAVTPEDGRPTFLEFTELFRNDDALPPDAWKALYAALERVRSLWPEMFQDEGY